MASRHSSSSGGPSPDSLVGNFRVGKEIGRGSFAVVFKGHHVKSPKSLAAVKVVQRGKLNRKLLENLESEIQILKKLDHSHIVALKDCSKNDKYIYIVMEYCSVGDLSPLIKTYPHVPGSGLHEVVARHFMKQLASALEYLRKFGLVHRDVKPQNLLLDPPAGYGSRTPLADFGFARNLPAASLADTLCGSPLYMAPEILRYEKYDATADLWKIETKGDTIEFPSSCTASEEIRGLICTLLRRNPLERMSFKEFFSHPVITGPIPGASVAPVSEPMQKTKSMDTPKVGPTSIQRTPSLRAPSDGREFGTDREGRRTPQQTPPSPRLRQAVESSALPFVHTSPISATPPPRLADIRRATTQGTQASPPSPLARPMMDRYTKRSSTAREMRPLEEERVEKDYVFVDKQSVQVNAFADELATVRRNGMTPPSPSSSALSRRPTSGGQGATNAIAVTGRRQDGGYPRNSYERRYGPSPGSAPSPSPSSTRSTLARALELANIRLFGVSISPPRHSPPNMQSPYPSYPNNPASMVMVRNEGGPSDDDMQAVHSIEDAASRSDVVYNFAEVKLAQLIPAVPVPTHGLGLLPPSASEGDLGLPTDPAPSNELDLTPDAIVQLAEEALVLYVKALGILAKAMDIAGAWWNTSSSRNNQMSPAMAAASTRMNNCVQWVRDRFNEVLEKADFVKRKLIEAQKLLPSSHPSHPNNLNDDSDGSLDASGDRVVVTPGVTAEKLMYDRALEMSRAAAVNELVGDDLNGCEVAYVTSIRMLEAVLENDSVDQNDGEGGMEEDDRMVVENYVSNIRKRLVSLKKKMSDVSKRSSGIHSIPNSPLQPSLSPLMGVSPK
ncbi:kinase-like protein [Choiromyces venosus 120613-1]|uniref:non-specific serine/threonine protein kinase n=1 Tax=Choiromyces venosus 120613-1 TaxID=1336337 RepID=A0A3N4IY89_9PEZI|nr:kinase-like protein [Choiromyces venosus 120613-1]